MVAVAFHVVVVVGSEVWVEVLSLSQFHLPSSPMDDGISMIYPHP